MGPLLLALCLLQPFSPPKHSPNQLKPNKTPLTTILRPIPYLIPHKKVLASTLAAALAAAVLKPQKIALAAAATATAAKKAGPLMGQTEMLARSTLWLLYFSLAAVLAGAETAITTLWPWKVKQLAAEDQGGPFNDVQSDITKVLTTALVGVTFCTVYGTALATDVAIHLFGQAGVAYATAALTLVTLIFGEILPKSLAVANAEKVARSTIPLINAVSFLLSPLVWLTTHVTRWMLQLLGVDHGTETVSENELRLMVTGAQQSGAVEGYEQDMIEGVLDLDLSTVEQIMQPRVDIVGIEQHDSLMSLIRLSCDTKYSRVPVYNRTIDHIVGVALTRDLIQYMERPSVEFANTEVGHVMEDIEFVPESMSAMNALKLMRQKRLHMVVVVDEYGGTSGIVTLEDILETLVGRIYDEKDDEEVRFEQMESIVYDEVDGSYSIDGMAELELVTDRLALQLPEEALNEYSTLSGFLCACAGEIPESGTMVRYGSFEFDVLEADERRILSIKARNSTVAEESEGKEDIDS